MSIGCFVFFVKSSGLSFFGSVPFGYGDTAFCVLEVLDCCGGLVDFVLEGEGFWRVRKPNMRNVCVVTKSWFVDWQEWK
jgi:hypothetical protein